MSHYSIRKIHIDHLLHLENIDISLMDKKYPHLVITGKNGSGKTILLNSIADLLQSSGGSVEHPLLTVEITNKDEVLISKKNHNQYGDIECAISGDIRGGILAFYQADRSIKMIEPNSPQKPQVNIEGIRNTLSDQFIKFLVDLKFQELLAISNHEQEKVNAIKTWFVDFESLLKEIFEDDKLTLTFEQENVYTFKITKGGQTFGFNEMSDGFKAVINIVADLILRMQDGGNVSSAYQKEGIVLIDEIETHLHLELQKIVMPFLTRVFPNIQFIVTTHSPFVLSSMPNAVAYDLEHQEPLEDLSNYSYESLAEGYFGVTAESSDLRLRLDTIKKLLEKDGLSASERSSLQNYIQDFDKIPEAISPCIIGEYLQTKIKYSAKIKEVIS